MPSIDVVIIKQGDPEEPPWIDKQHPSMVGDTEHWDLCVLEHGMQSGLASIMVRFEDTKQGKVAIGETSLAAWIAVTCAMRAAFPEEFFGTPLQEES